YARPATVAEAIAMLASTPDAKVLAGGQTLGPMPNPPPPPPARAVALNPHPAIEDGRVPEPPGGFFARVAHGIASRAVRTRGTIGGSLAHADPAADWLSCLAALGAEVVIAGAGGT